MLNEKVINKIINLTMETRNFPQGKSSHFTFVLYKSKIIAIGKNKCKTTHPKAVKYGYRFHGIHSELHAMLQCEKMNYDLSKCTIINTRLGLDRTLRMSKPCSKCQKLLKDFGITAIFYTDYNGQLCQFFTKEQI